MSSWSAAPNSRHNAHLAMSLKVKGQRRLNFRRRGTGRTLSALLDAQTSSLNRYSAV